MSTENQDDIIRFLTQAGNVWKGGIPQGQIHSSDPDNKFKCRISWFTGVAASLYWGLQENIFPDSVALKIKEWLDWYKTRNPKNRDTLIEEINITDEIISIATGSSSTGHTH